MPGKQADEYWPGKSLEDILQIKEDYKREINSSGAVPAIYIGGVVITEADVASEFLEDRFPDSGNPLMPADAVGRSKVRHLIKELNGSNGVSAMYGLLMNQDPAQDEALRNKIYKFLETFVKLSNGNGPYFLDTFSLADVLLMPMYDQFRAVLAHYRGVEFIPSDHEDYPWAAKMQAWADAVQQRDSFTKCSLNEEVYVGLYGGYAGARGVSQFGL